LRPIEHLIRDGEISEIMVNGSGRVLAPGDDPQTVSRPRPTLAEPATAMLDHWSSRIEAPWRSHNKLNRIKDR
jgi:hypothetical protein